MNISKLNKFTKGQLISSIIELCDRNILKWEQIEKILDEQLAKDTKITQINPKSRLSEEYVLENMEKSIDILEKIENQELIMSAYWYEDYSEGYWGCKDVWEYEDSDGITEMLAVIIKFAKECMDDCWYDEALSLYDRILDIEIFADDQCDGVMVGLEELVTSGTMKIDLKSMCLNTLYCDYQVREKKDRVEDLHTYFSYSVFKDIKIQDMFQVGRQQLDEEDVFWEQWIQYLLVSENNTDSRLLKEAIEFCCDEKKILALAEQYYKNHPALYLYAIEKCVKRRDYQRVLQIGEDAMEKLNDRWKIRAEIAKIAAECTGDTETKYYYRYEAFRSDSSVENLLVLFENKVVAEKYGIKCKNIIPTAHSSDAVEWHVQYAEKRCNHISKHTYNTLLFFGGEFATVQSKCKNPPNSLGWSTCYIKQGIYLFLMYLYEGENIEKETALREIGSSFGRSVEMKEGRFLELFKKWKQYYPMEITNKQDVLQWAEKIIRKRVDAIVGGQHRAQYGEVAALLGAVAEIRESWGERGVKHSVRQEYKNKYPRHSSFQGQLNLYLGKLK